MQFHFIQCYVMLYCVLCSVVPFVGITLLDFLRCFPLHIVCMLFSVRLFFLLSLFHTLQHVFRYDKNNIFRLSFFFWAHGIVHSCSCMQSFTVDEMLSHIHFHIWMCWLHCAHCTLKMHFIVFYSVSSSFLFFWFVYFFPVRSLVYFSILFSKC